MFRVPRRPRHCAAQGSILKNTHLINFNTTIVTKDTRTGKLEYNSFGSGSGKCYLTCHGKVHSGTSYSLTERSRNRASQVREKPPVIAKPPKR